MVTCFEEDFMSLLKANSQVNEIIDKACKFIEYKVLAVGHIFKVHFFLFFVTYKIFEPTEPSFEYILFLRVWLLGLSFCLLF